MYFFTHDIVLKRSIVMKKKAMLLALAGVLLAAMAMSGCGTVKIIAIDETVPVDETAVVYPYSWKLGKVDGTTLTLKSLDGRSLPKGFHENNPLRIPAGESRFIADAKWYSGLTTISQDSHEDPQRQYFSKKKVQFTYDFKAGASYYLEPVLGGGEGAGVRMPIFLGGFLGPKRVGGEPFIGQMAIYAVTEYDKRGFPVVTDDELIEVIGFDTEVSF
jgi:hypothetical protein